LPLTKIFSFDIISVTNEKSPFLKALLEAKPALRTAYLNSL